MATEQVDLLTRVETIERRVREATAGPWLRAGDGVEELPDVLAANGGSLIATVAGGSVRVSQMGRLPKQRRDNAELIANAPTDLAFLCAEVRRQQGIIQAVEAVCARCEPIDAGTNDVVDRTIRAITSSIRRALSSAEAT